MSARRATKRALDLALVLLSAPLTVALLAIAAAAVRLLDGRPVLFRQVRCGVDGRRFVLLKLRTMAVGRGRDAEGGWAGCVTATGDPRVTRCGAILRRTKLDELPQLWNVLRGDMSLVGPRPEVPSWVDRFPAEFRLVHALPPGLTDFASIYFRDEADLLQRLVAADPAASVDSVYAAAVLPSKLELNRRYTERSGPLLDLALIAVTLYAVVFRQVPVGALTRLSGAGPPACLGDLNARPRTAS